jgi:hypothetical protein
MTKSEQLLQSRWEWLWSSPSEALWPSLPPLHIGFRRARQEKNVVPTSDPPGNRFKKSSPAPFRFGLFSGLALPVHVIVGKSRAATLQCRLVSTIQELGRIGSSIIPVLL